MVPGPGPVEPRKTGAEDPESPLPPSPTTKPPPSPRPPGAASNFVYVTAPPPADSTDSEPLSLNTEDDEPQPAARGSDPYSNLDGAFGNYLADEPRPMGANNRAGGAGGDLDDLLF